LAQIVTDSTMWLQGVVLGVLAASFGQARVQQDNDVQNVWDSGLFPSAHTILLRPSGRPFTITVEGNVGSGKSTLLQYFQRYPDIAVYPEPVPVWTNLNGTDFLGLVYQDPPRWGMTFESLVQLTMLEHHMKQHREKGKKTSPVKIMERSLQSCRYCFVEQLGPVMTPGEREVLHSWYRLLHDQKEFDIDVDVVIYLRTDPDVIYERVAKRNRKEEMKIPLSYFKEMHRLHEAWLMERTSAGSADLPPVIVIDANQDISVLQKTYRKLAKDIYKSIPEEMKTDIVYN